MWILLVSLVIQGAAEAQGPGLAPLERMGQFNRRDIPEASGIVKSRRHPGIFWVHNDSGNSSLLFAVRADGQIVRRFRLAFRNLDDWEGIAIDDQGHLYLGDIGNNDHQPRVRTIYRIDEPDPSAPKGEDRDLPATRTVKYVLPPSNPFDAEGLVVHRGTAIVVAKYSDGREAELFAVPVDPPPTDSVPVRSIGRLPGFTEKATGADLSADGTLLAVCSYAVARVYRRGEAGAWDRLAEVRWYPHHRIEGITWDGRDLILAAEHTPDDDPPQEGRLYRLREQAWRDAAAKQARSAPKTER